MKQSPSSEAKTSSASQEIPRILYHLGIQYRIHNSRPHVPVLSQTNSVYAPHPASWRSI